MASQEATGSLEECKDELEKLRAKLEPKGMHRFGLWALKWPFSSQEVHTINRLKHMISWPLLLFSWPVPETLVLPL